MSVKIIIERKFKEGAFPEKLEAINEIRIKGIQQKGYMYGETLINFENNRDVVVLSVWASLDDWKTWFNSQGRRKLENELAAHLEEPAKIRAFMSGADIK